MLGTVTCFLLILPVIVKCSGDGNIRLLEDEVAIALKSCVGNDKPNKNDNKNKENSRQRRSDDFGDPYYDRTPKIDSNMNQQTNLYSHERRNTSDIRDQLHVLNATDYDYGDFGAGKGSENLVNTVPRPAMGSRYNYSNGNDNSFNRTKRNDPLLNKPDSDQCLSQCVFANLQVVDSRGIPREAEMWNKVQASVTSQQSRAAIRDQIRACFQELQTDAEDNGCSYSNKLEKCLMLRFSERKLKQDLPEEKINN